VLDGVDEELLDALGGEGDSIDEAALERFALPFAPALALQPRAYQREALGRWLASGGRGVVVLPTGAGKTVVAFMALEQVPARTLIVVPTIDLLQQWRRGLIEKAGVPADQVGVIGGGERSTAPVTVVTYDSAAMPRRRLDGYGLLIVDEVHHLPALADRSIAGKVNAPLRLGLSATPERSDQGHEALDGLVGPIVYRKSAAEQSRDQHIAAYTEDPNALLGQVVNSAGHIGCESRRIVGMSVAVRRWHRAHVWPECRRVTQCGGNGHHASGVAVVGIPRDDDTCCVRVHFGHPQRQVIGFRAGAGIHHLVDLVRHGRQQSFGVVDDAAM